MGTAYRARANGRGFFSLRCLEGGACAHLQFLGPESILRLVEYVCSGKPVSRVGAIIGVRYLVPLLWFVNGVEWSLIVLHFSGHLR
jgi:hypothetical protein